MKVKKNVEAQARAKQLIFEHTIEFVGRVRFTNVSCIRSFQKILACWSKFINKLLNSEFFE